MKLKDLKPLLRSSDPNDVRMLCILLLNQMDLRKLLARSQVRWLYKHLWSIMQRRYNGEYPLCEGIHHKTWQEIYPTARMPYYTSLKKLCKLIAYGEKAYYEDDLLEGSRDLSAGMPSDL